ncbi:MAG: pilus assembly protein TadG-related protein [Gemmatimonadota bacterium]|nr:pilus assembly protein TadG-related protein [Gemmatimonadota bacterium]
MGPAAHADRRPGREEPAIYVPLNLVLRLGLPPFVENSVREGSRRAFPLGTACVLRSPAWVPFLPISPAETDVSGGVARSTAIPPPGPQMRSDVMSEMPRTRRGLGERGAVSVMTALGIIMLLGATALAVDLGHLLNVRTESQRVADAAALAGAAAFIDAPGPTVAATARTWAIQFASQNVVNQTPVTLQPNDIDVNTALRQVQVTVHHDAARGNPVSTIFARVFGINAVDVRTVAMAEAWPAVGVNCILPLFLIDQWDERGGDPQGYDTGIDYYEPYVPGAPTGTYTGYDQSDVGTSIIIKPAQGNQNTAPNQSWYYPFDAANVPGGANYRTSIANCVNPGFTYQIGDLLWVEPGAMIGPTAQGFNDLINQDPGAAYDPGLKCIVDQSNVGSGNAANCRGSPRLRPAPMFDPSTAPASGKKQVAISNFAGLFVDQVQGNNVYVIFMGYSGILPAAGTGGGGSTPPIALKLRLIG